MSNENTQADGAPLVRQVRPDVAMVMGAVWALVRSGPNFDGRQRDVEAAIDAVIGRAVAAERKWWADVFDEIARSAECDNGHLDRITVEYLARRLRTA